MISRNALEWYFQRVTGGLLLVLLAAHFWVEHFMTAPLRHGDLTFEVIASRISNPAWQAIDIGFLIVALFHGLNGLRNILLDYGRLGKRGAAAMNLVLVVIGVAWAWWGISAFSRL
jgi:succinate dehydrogenase / fumarate reductase, membrane anchor subunit